MKETTENIYSRLLKAQMEIVAIKKDSKNPFFNSSYFDINAILNVVKPILNKHGLVLTQALNVTEGKLGLLTAITDCDSKEQITSNCYLPETLDAQKTGSAVTYFRRYSLQSLLALEAEDDDGNVASGKPSAKGKTTGNKPMDDFIDGLEKDIKHAPGALSATGLR